METERMRIQTTTETIFKVSLNVYLIPGALCLNESKSFPAKQHFNHDQGFIWQSIVVLCFPVVISALTMLCIPSHPPPTVSPLLPTTVHKPTFLLVAAKHHIIILNKYYTFLLPYWAKITSPHSSDHIQWKQGGGGDYRNKQSYVTKLQGQHFHCIDENLSYRWAKYNIDYLVQAKMLYSHE